MQHLLKLLMVWASVSLAYSTECIVKDIDYDGLGFMVTVPICSSEANTNVNIILCAEYDDNRSKEVLYKDVAKKHNRKEVVFNIDDFEYGTKFPKVLCASQLNDLKPGNECQFLNNKAAKCIKTYGIKHMPVVKSRDGILNLVKDYTITSHKYLLWSTGMASRNHERPGLSKYLRELSDTYWENGLKIIKKFYEKGGKIATADAAKFFNGEMKSHKGYTWIFEQIIRDSKKLNKDLQTLAFSTTDEEFKHFIEEIQEEETERLRTAQGRYQNIRFMDHSNFAIVDFDKSLK